MNGITAKWIFHQIWIMIEKSLLMKWSHLCVCMHACVCPAGFQTGNFLICTLQPTCILYKGPHVQNLKLPDTIMALTHWGRVTHICISNIITGWDNGLSPGWRQAIIWTSTGILLIGVLGTYFSEILIGIHTFSFNKMHLNMSVKWWPLYLGLSVLILSREGSSSSLVS